MASGTATRLLIVSAVLALVAAWAHARPRATDGDPFDFTGVVPLAFEGWVGREAPPLDPAVARVLAADQYVHRFYGTTSNAQRGVNSGSHVEMDIAYYAQPQAGAAMHSPLNCLPGNGWEIMESSRMPVVTPAAAVNVRRLVVAQNGHRVAMTYWFQNRGVIVGTEYRQRFQLLANGLRGDQTDAALVRVMANDNPAGQQALRRFTTQIAGMLEVAFR